MIAMYVQDEEGNYQTSNSKEFPREGYVLNIEKSTCKNGGILSQDPTTKAINLKVRHSDACNLYFDKEDPTLRDYYENVAKKTWNPNFTKIATTDETADGLFAMEDDYGTSYYFRGAVENNYIKFGKNASGQDMWWRIIRFNGDETVRIIYDGTKAHANQEDSYDRLVSTSQAWNSRYDDAKYMGWMFGGAQGVASTSKEQAQKNETNSLIKTVVDNWYKSNIHDTGYHNYIADSIFCNDRSFEPGNTGTGYGTSRTNYGARGRSGISSGSAQPILRCPQNNDKFTVEVSSGGNGASTYPVGLITADEIIIAGSGDEGSGNYDYYIYKGKSHWSMSPDKFINNSGAYVYSDMGMLAGFSCNLTSGGFAPVINLKAEFLDKLRGYGTMDRPYTIVPNNINRSS